MTERICEKCGIVLRDVHGNTRYCEFCKVEVEKEQVRKRVENYRERWGWNNKNECLGSGRLSPKPKPNFDDEKIAVRYELKRLGIR